MLDLGFRVLSLGEAPYPGVPKRSRSSWKTLWSTARPGPTTSAHCQRILIYIAEYLAQCRDTNGAGSGMIRYTSLLAALGMAPEQQDILRFWL